MSEISTQLGQRIRELRTGRQMSQEELAFKSQISPAHLGQIERGLKNPTVDTVFKIASALDVSIAELFTETPIPPSSHNAVLEKINAQLLYMEEDEQKDILRVIRIFRGHCNRRSIIELGKN